MAGLPLLRGAEECLVSGPFQGGARADGFRASGFEVLGFRIEDAAQQEERHYVANYNHSSRSNRNLVHRSEKNQIDDAISFLSDDFHHHSLCCWKGNVID